MKRNSNRRCRNSALFQRPCHNQFANLFFAIPKDRFQDILIISPQRWSATLDLSRGPGQTKARAFNGGMAVRWMLELHKMFTICELRIFIGLMRRAYCSRGYPARLEHGFNTERVKCLGPYGHLCVEFVLMGETGFPRGKSFIAQ